MLARSKSAAVVATIVAALTLLAPAASRAATLQSIAVTPSNPSLQAGASLQFTATGTFDDNTTADLTQQVTWASSFPAVATISDASGIKGRATGVSSGVSIISATLEGITGSTPLTVTPAPVLVSIAVTPVDPTVAPGASRPLTATGTYSDGTAADLTATATWTSSAPRVVAVSSAGVVSAVGTGSATISATVGGVTGATTVTVRPSQLVAITLTPAGPTLTVGDVRLLTAVGVFADGSTRDLSRQVTWSSLDNRVVRVSNASATAGRVTAIAPGSATVTARYRGLTGSTTVTVLAAQLVAIDV